MSNRFVRQQTFLLNEATLGCGSVIKISRGYSTLVDASYYNTLISMGKWSSFDCNGTFYAGKKKNGKLIMLARYIMNAPAQMIVDHKNGNTLDNRQCNLRLTSRGGNRRNKHTLQSNSKSGIEGVRQSPTNPNKWTVHLTMRHERLYLGTYNSFADAVAVRLAAVQKFFGEETCSTSTLHQNNLQLLQQQWKKKHLL